MRSGLVSSPMILALDAGTQSIRAIVFDLRGNIIAQVKTPITAYVSPHPGWAEQDPDYFWDKLCACTRALTELPEYDPSLVKGLCLTTQRATVINADQDGNALRPAICWLDQRKAKPERWPPWWLRIGMWVVGKYRVVRHAQRECEANWLRQNQPEIWAATDKFVFLSGWFHHKLMDKWVESEGNVVGYLPFDTRRRRWGAKGSLRSRIMPVEPEKLPELFAPGTVLGTLTPDAAQATGLPEGLPVIAGAADKACEALGAGATRPDLAHLSYGTTATIGVTTPRYVEVIRNLPPYPSALPGHFNTEVMIFRGFWMVSWFKEEFGLREVLMAEDLEESPEHLFDDMVREVPPGSLGLTLLPYWSPGIVTPGPEAKGAIIGFGDVHRREHLYRAILEGLAYGLKAGLTRTEKATGTKIRSLRVAGGGSQSDQALQITADIFDLPVERPHTFETSALGAAIIGAVGLGLHPDFETAVAAMCRIKDRFLPKPENVSLYRQLFREVYGPLYGRLRPLFRAIRKITGYPGE